LDFHVADYITHVGNKRVRSVKEFDRAISAAVKTSSQIIIKTSAGCFGVFESHSKQ
jgi:hypothetical protein